MSSRIKLVKNDNRPDIELTLTNQATGAAIDVSAATVVVKFRAEGGSEVLAELACTNVTEGDDGKVTFNFPDATLDVDPGNYEGEIEITHENGDKQTVYEVLKFTVRDEF
jgi:hypothetical protein